MGMIYVTFGGKFRLPEPTEAQGGSAWGAGTVASNHGARQTSEYELEAAQTQG